MKIYLYLDTKIMTFILPEKVSGIYSFDEDEKESSKLINIKEENGIWVIIPTEDVKLEFGRAELKIGRFYTLERYNIKYTIYISSILDETFVAYNYQHGTNIKIGNGEECNIKYKNKLINGLCYTLIFQENGIVMNYANNKVYLNNSSINNSQNSCYIYCGDEIDTYGLKIIILNGFFLINNPNNNVEISNNLKISKIIYEQKEQENEFEIKEKNLYSPKDYYIKSPRIRRTLKTKKIKILSPPNENVKDKTPTILIIGPMLTMSIVSFTMIANNIARLINEPKAIKTIWPTLISSIAMLISMILWPTLTRKYQEKVTKDSNKKISDKYEMYLIEKKREFEEETELQREIILENLVSLEECLNIINEKKPLFWSKRIDQNDFLEFRIGYGKLLLDVEIDTNNEETLEEKSILKEKESNLIETYKYINNVPTKYSFHQNKITAIMGNDKMVYGFINNIILQLITFYSYEDIKIVIFTNKLKEDNWQYTKYLKHTFSNDETIRYYSTNINSARIVMDQLNLILKKKDEEKEKKKPYYIIITDDYQSINSFSFIKEISEREEDTGFSIIIIENRMNMLPSKCNNFIKLNSEKCEVITDSYDEQEKSVFNNEINYNIDMMEVSRIVSNIPIEIDIGGVGILPNSISFLEMERVGNVEQLNIENRWEQNDPTQSIKAQIGVDKNGNAMYLDLHEKYHGPHGLVAGTTGSGKSEFIITYILSMAINYSPEYVAFIIIDYKGGGLAYAFENKTTGKILPHLAGTITNLDKAEMSRTLVSINSEAQRRQKVFNEARDKLEESTMDIYKYQRYYREGKLKEPIPHLFIICDEFAELKAQQPEFMENLISIARIGRSLGVHLILATQKPSGVVNEQIWSNTKFRVCLKVQNEADSREMLKKPDAAFIKQAGRYYLQVGVDDYYELGQSGWCGAKYYPSDKIISEIDKSVNVINDHGEIITSSKEENSIKIESQGEQIAAIMNKIIDVSRKEEKIAKRLWLDDLYDNMTINKLQSKYNYKINKEEFEIIIGEYDYPEKQTQGIVNIKLLQDGNTIIYSNGLNDTELMLETIIYEISYNYDPSEISIYCIDYGTQKLRLYNELPHVGAIVFEDEKEKYDNLFSLIVEEQEKRKKMLSEMGIDYSIYIKNNRGKMPLMIIILNNYDIINSQDNNLFERLPKMVSDSERYGIIFYITNNRVNGISTKIENSFNKTFAFKLKDNTYYSDAMRKRCKIELKDIEGRGVCIVDNTVQQFQLSRIIDRKNNEMLSEIIKNYTNQANLHYINRAKKVKILPEQLTYDYIKDEKITSTLIPIGISKKKLKITNIDLQELNGYIITTLRIKNAENFVKSFASLIKKIPDTGLIIGDITNTIDSEDCKNYFSDSKSFILNTLAGIKKLKEDNSTKQILIFVYKISEIIEEIKANKKEKMLDELADTIKEYKNAKIIVLDETSFLKNYTYESWYKKLFNNSYGTFIGKGIEDQSIIKVSNSYKETSLPIDNDMGFIVEDTVGVLSKIIDFTLHEE